ncbi:MAG: SpvB/TcaC N-terminal domain-containing protein [Minicystis sp.]
MLTKLPPGSRSVEPVPARAFRTWTLLFLLLACVFAQGGCSCGPDLSIPAPRPLLVCRPHVARLPAAPPVTPGAPTVAAGTIPQTFSVSNGGSATLVLPLTVVPGRAGVEPSLSLTYGSDAAASDGILGAGFALGGITSITRCGSTLARDGEIRAVRFDAGDNVCLSGQRLIRVASTPGLVEFRTFPDSFTKVVGHYTSEEDKPGNAVSFEIFLPSGLVIDAGTSAASKPLAPGGVARAWLTERAHDGRGQASAPERGAERAKSIPRPTPAIERRLVTHTTDDDEAHQRPTVQIADSAIVRLGDEDGERESTEEMTRVSKREPGGSPVLAPRG